MLWSVPYIHGSSSSGHMDAIAAECIHLSQQNPSFLKAQTVS